LSGIFLGDKARVVLNWHVWLCVLAGLVSGLVIGLVTEYYTSHAYKPVRVSFYSGVTPLVFIQKCCYLHIVDGCG
jgi:Na+/H+-translocating membrane pyrophosphatase